MNNCPICGGSMIGGSKGICEDCGFEASLEEIREYEFRRRELIREGLI